MQPPLTFSVQELASLISDLNSYSLLADFIERFALEIKKKSEAEESAGRKYISGQLFCSFIHLRAAANEMREARSTNAQQVLQSPPDVIQSVEMET